MDIGMLVAMAIFPSLFALAGIMCLAEEWIERIQDKRAAR